MQIDDLRSVPAARARPPRGERAHLVVVCHARHPAIRLAKPLEVARAFIVAIDPHEANCSVKSKRSASPTGANERVMPYCLIRTRGRL